ncbi:hypothetical protein WME94_15840 [Sorangium sp. So ce429]
MPAPETCADTRDEDCDAKDCILWSNAFGDVSDQRATAVAIDRSGNIYVAGSFRGTLAFSEQPVSANGLDSYIAKFDSSGRNLWSLRFDQVNDIVGIALDESGNPSIAGEFIGRITIGDTAHESSYGPAAILVKLTPEGTTTWSKKFESNEETYVRHVAIDPYGSAIMFGESLCTTNCQPPSNNMWLTKHTSDGTLEWSKEFNEEHGTRTAGGLAADPFGNIVITGAFAQSERFGDSIPSGGTITSKGGLDAFVVKFDSAGALVWQMQYGDGENQAGTSVACDRFGNVIVSGSYAGSVDFGTTAGSIAATDGTDVFIVKLSSDKVHLWGKSLGGPGDARPERTALDTQGNVFVTGRAAGQLDYGDGLTNATGSLNTPLIKFSSDGTHIWNRVFAREEHAEPTVIATSPDGEVVLASSLKGALDLGAGSLRSAGGFDVLLAKFAP